jgi:FKBP-type peptidyl-prolyl cis-trans isomerase FkpA
MKQTIQFLLLILFWGGSYQSSLAQAIVTPPDSVKATSIMVTIVPGTRTGVKTWSAGIAAGSALKLELFKQKKNTGIGFRFPEGATIIALGNGVSKSKTRLEYPVKINPSADFRLMVSMAADSAGNFVIYSAYAFLPDVSKWKLIGTCKVAGFVPFLPMTSSFWTGPPKDSTSPVFKEEWLQLANGTWKSQVDEKAKAPVINLLSHTDSLAQMAIETEAIKKAIAAGKTDAVNEYKGLYYVLMNEGTGKQVSVTDTVLVNYKGYLFSDGTIFDQTTGTPRKFPLGRLIMGWQIGIPLLKTGGKIKLVIPSHLAYSIRTRSPKIPPNSTLVFEIEVLEATPALR